MEKTFTVYCTMEDKWIPSFVKMLSNMECNGENRKSYYVGMYSDGDGDYRPKFAYSQTALGYNINNFHMIENPSGKAVMYDAG